ncbi:TPA: hypothetical protein ACPWRN_005419 [Pseudomonas aeruginosa]
MSMELNKANECSCPSGDGSLVHPCPAHPAVEQAGGDERAAFEAYRDRRNALLESEGHKPGSKWHVTNAHYPTWEASRAALAQPSPKCATCGGTGMVDDGEITCSEGGIPYENGPVKCVKDCPDCKAQPSPPPHPAPELDFSRPLETENGDPVKWICADVIEYKSARVCVANDTGLVYSSPYIGLKIRNVMPEQAEAERPEMSPERAAYFMRRFKSEEKLLGPNEQAAVDYVLSLLAQHDRIVGELRAKAVQLREALEWRAENQAGQRELLRSVKAERDAALARVAELEQKSAGSWTVDTSCGRPILMYEGCSVIEDQTAYEVIRMIKWIGELERQEPVATVAKVPGEDWNSLDFHRDLQDMQPGTKLYAAPVAQAQQLNDLDKQCRDDVARALGLRPNQERGFAWSYLLASIKSCVKASGDSAQAQHSVPDGAADLCRFLAKLYCELDGLRYSTAKLPAEQIADALIFKWPVLQGARNQLNIKRISEQPYDESKLHSAIAAMLAAAPARR